MNECRRMSASSRDSKKLGVIRGVPGFTTQCESVQKAQGYDHEPAAACVQLATDLLQQQA
jgi:hypothetical protein